MRKMKDTSPKGWIYVLTVFLLGAVVSALAGILLPNWFVVKCRDPTAITNDVTYTIGLWTVCGRNHSRDSLFIPTEKCSPLENSLQQGYQLPVWMTGTRVLEVSGCVGSVLTLFLVIGFCLAPGSLASEAAQGIAFACLGIASFLFSGVLHVMQGSHKLNNFLSYDACNIGHVRYSSSITLTLFSVACLILCTIISYKEILTFMPDDSEAPRSRQTKIRRK